ncbi:MAG: 50S ribosomal protein L18 [Sphingobacteriales bacterium]|nr:50S ribosomal protein L18 [Sphingobacteriales bacterium]
MATLTKKDRRKKIHYKIRKKISGTSQRPRLSVFRSNSDIYAQVIDDTAGRTIVCATSKDKSISEGTKSERAKKVGQMIAEKAKAAGIDTIVFDRSGYLYHGRVKALAEGAREGGLNF